MRDNNKGKLKESVKKTLWRASWNQSQWIGVGGENKTLIGNLEMMEDVGHRERARTGGEIKQGRRD